MSEQVKYVLDESRLPEAWYNIAADLQSPPPPVLHPGTGQPVGPDDLAPLFPMAIIGQEVSTDRLIAIPVAAATKNTAGANSRLKSIWIARPGAPSTTIGSIRPSRNATANVAGP